MSYIQTPTHTHTHVNSLYICLASLIPLATRLVTQQIIVKFTERNGAVLSRVLRHRIRRRLDLVASAGDRE